MKWTVIDNETGKEPDLETIAMREDWAQRLIPCDMEGFALDQNCNLILLDECGNYVNVPMMRFKIIIEID